MPAEDIISSFYDLNSIKLESESVLRYLNETISLIKQINILKNEIDKPLTFRSLGESVEKAKRLINELEQANVKLGEAAVSAAKKQVDAYTQLKQQYRDAESNAKAIAAQYGIQSEQAVKAAQAADLYFQKLKEINTFVKEGGTQKQGSPVPFSNNLAELEAERESLKKTGEVVNDLDKAEADAANSATAMGSSFKEMATHTDETNKNIGGIIGSLDEYTGSLRQNLGAQIENNIALTNNKAAQKEIEQSIRLTGTATTEQIGKLTALKEEELLLIESNKNLSLTIKNQAKEFVSAAGSIDEAQARLALMQNTYESFSAAEKAAPIGQNLKAQIDVLDPALKEMEGNLGRNQRNVGNYSNAITKSLSGAYSFIRQLAYILPGIGIAGIMNVLFEGIQSVVEEMSKGNNAFDLFKTNLQNLNDTMEEANKSAGKEVSSLKILYGAATDINESMDVRLKAVLELKKEFPEYFGQIDNEIIMNGKAKTSYDELTESILKTAKANAAKGKIDEIENQRLAIAFQKQKIENATTNEKANAKDEHFIVNTGGGFSSGTNDQSSLQTKEQAIGIIEERRKQAVGIQDKADKALQNQEDFLIKYVGAGNLVKSITDANKGKGPNLSSKDTLSDLYKYLDETRKAQFETQQQQLKDKAEFDKSIVEDDKKTFAERIKATGDYYTDNLSILERQRDFELIEAGNKTGEEERKVIKELQNNKLTAQQRKDLQETLKAIDTKGEADRELIYAKYNTAVLKLNQESEKQITEVVKNDSEQRRKEREEELKAQIENAEKKRDASLRQIENDANKELEHEAFKYSRGEENKKTYENKKLEIENNARKLSLLAEIDYQRFLLSIADLPEEKRIKALQDLAKAEKELHKLGTSDIVADTEAVKKYHDQVKQLLIDLGNQLKNSFFSILEGGIQRQKNHVQDQMDSLDKLTQKEIDAVDQSVASQQDKAAKIAIINAKAQAQKEQLEARQRQLDKEKAKIEKAKAIAEVIENTAIGITKTIAEVPKADFGISTGALIALYSAIGAAQIATILATPAYFKGTKDHPGGPAIVGDAFKKELVITPEGKMFETPDKPTFLPDLPKHSVVLPDLPSPEVLAMMTQKVAERPQKSQDNAQLNSSIRRMENNVVKAINNIPQTNIVVESPLRKWVRSQGGTNNKMN